MSKIAITIVCTNAYFVLAIRFVKKFVHHYKGDKKFVFFLFTDEDPRPYFPDDIDIRYIHTVHTKWTDGTNSKFKNIINIKDQLDDITHIYQFDADTSVSKDFNEEWFMGDLVGGEHYGNRGFLKDGKGFDRYEKSHAYVPLDSKLPYTYHYGAFFGGKKENVIAFCQTLRDWQIADQAVGYEPPVNDESYINCYFHFNPPYTVPLEKFMFDISHKGGIGETRNTKLDIKKLKSDLLINKNNLIDIMGGKVCKL